MTETVVCSVWLSVDAIAIPPPDPSSVIRVPRSDARQPRRAVRRQPNGPANATSRVNGRPKSFEVADWCARRSLSLRLAPFSVFTNHVLMGSSGRYVTLDAIIIIPEGYVVHGELNYRISERFEA